MTPTFDSKFPQIAINEYSKNIGKSKDIMEHYIGVLADEGVTFVPIWTEPPEAATKEKTEVVAKEEAEVEDDAEKKKKAESGSTVAQVSLTLIFCAVVWCGSTCTYCNM